MKLLITFLISLLAACTMNGQQAGTASTEEFEKLIAASNVQVLDVRTAEEYKSGHIENALQANWLNKSEFFDRTAHLDKSKQVYIYCLSGGRSAAAADALREKGYRVTNLEGGITAWKKSNTPLKGVDPNAKQTSIASYQGQVQSTTWVLVDFGAAWCPPCIRMEPVIQAFMKENANKLTLIKMDGGIETELMKSLNIEALPTFILYQNGKEVKRKQGLVSKEEFNSWLTR